MRGQRVRLGRFDHLGVGVEDRRDLLQRRRGGLIEIERLHEFVERTVEAAQIEDERGEHPDLRPSLDDEPRTDDDDDRLRDVAD